MLDSALTKYLEEQLSEQLSQVVSIIQAHATGGGCINDAYHLSLDNGKHVFIKLNQRQLLDMFEAEAEGLVALAAADCFVIPVPIMTGTWHNQSFLILEYLEFSGRYTDVDFATRLAHLHQHTNDRFGFHRNNYIGASTQANTWHNNWFEFFMQERLEYQLKMLADKGRAGRLTSLWPELCHACEQLFGDHKPEASLLHGDLWQGNVSQTSSGCSIYDPACYYGDHEADLAMLNLFGHLTEAFYSSYQGIKTISPGYELRITWYNLYHVLNHANLFGGSYTGQAENMVQQLTMTLNR